MKIGPLTVSSDRALIMGIVNVTPDSFSDGGRFFHAPAAISHALALLEEGADILDIGGESSRPGAEAISVEEELHRVLPVIEGIRKHSDVAISIDTTKATVAARAIEAGADMINDISAGRFDPEILSVAARQKAALSLMHMQGTPRDMQQEPHYEDVIGEIRAFLHDAIDRAVAQGVARDQIVIDPGIGFGKRVQDNIRILQELTVFRTFGCPILIGTSRKSFIGKILKADLEERLEGSLATLAVAYAQGAHLFRVHDVAATRRFITMLAAFMPEGCSSTTRARGAS